MGKNSMPRVIVQILSWNQVYEVIDCLDSFSSLDYQNYKIILVDNGSEDNTVQTVRKKFPHVTVIENKENLGFCKGNNIGFDYCLKQDFDYLLLLNSDTKVLPNLVSELVRVMQSDSKIGIAGAKNLLMENPDYMWGQYGKVTWGPMLVKTIGRREPDRKLNEQPKNVDWIICNGCMISRAALEKVGGFDEDFWQCMEDVDWSYRSRKAGFRIVYADTASILHKGGSSADFGRNKIFSYGYFIGRNAIMFAKKYAKPHQMAKLIIMVTIGVILRITYSLSITIKDGLKPIVQKFLNPFFGQRYFIRGVLDGLQGKLSPDQMIINTSEIQIAQQKTFKQGIMARFKIWFGY